MDNNQKDELDSSEISKLKFKKVCLTKNSFRISNADIRDKDFSEFYVPKEVEKGEEIVCFFRTFAEAQAFHIGALAQKMLKID